MVVQVVHDSELELPHARRRRQRGPARHRAVEVAPAADRQAEERAHRLAHGRHVGQPPVHEGLLDLGYLDLGVLQRLDADHAHRFNQRLGQEMEELAIQAPHGGLAHAEHLPEKRQADRHRGAGAQLHAHALAVLAQHAVAEPIAEQGTLLGRRDLMDHGLDQPAIEPVGANGCVHAAAEGAYLPGLERDHRRLDLPTPDVDEDHQPRAAPLDQVDDRGQGGGDLGADEMHAGPVRGLGQGSSRLRRRPCRSGQGHPVDWAARANQPGRHGLLEQGADQRFGLVHLPA